MCYFLFTECRKKCTCLRDQFQRINVEKKTTASSKKFLLIFENSSFTLPAPLHSFRAPPEYRRPRNNYFLWTRIAEIFRILFIALVEAKLNEYTTQLLKH